MREIHGQGTISSWASLSRCLKPIVPIRSLVFSMIVIATVSCFLVSLTMYHKPPNPKGGEPRFKPLKHHEHHDHHDHHDHHGKSARKRLKPVHEVLQQPNDNADRTNRDTVRVSSGSSLSSSQQKSRSERLDDIARSLQQTRVDCSALFQNDERTVGRAVATAKILAAEEERIFQKNEHKMQKKVNEDSLAKQIQSEVKEWAGEFIRLTNKWYLNATQNCEMFKWSRGYINSPLTQEEEEFPIAYSILVFKDIEMVERLLRSIYRPQNRYCIHVDIKSDSEFYRAVKALVNCFSDNVRMSSRRLDVQWATYSVLEPELVCMQDLWDMDKEEQKNIQKAAPKDGPKVHSKKVKKHWKYFINLTGQEFPLKTNYELVQIIKALKGANSEEGTRKRANKGRWKSKAPYDIIPAKGGVHTLFNRATVDFILHTETARSFLEWVKGTDYPDETFFASINFNPHLKIPGTYNGTQMEENTSLTRYKQWYGRNCSSKQTVRGICIISTGDLYMLGPSPFLFANKFYLHEDRIVIGCLEEKIFNDTRDEFKGLKTFDTSYYSKQDFVINQVRG